MKLDHELITQIALEVIKRLDELVVKPKENDEQVKSSVLIIREQERTKQEIENLIQPLPAEWEILTRSPKEIEDLSFIHFLNINRAYFVDVNQDLIVRGALGLTDTPSSKLLAQLILENIPTIFVPAEHDQWLLQNDVDLTTPANVKNYKKHILQSKQTIESYGVIFQQRLDSVSKNKSEANQSKTTAQVHVAGRARESRGNQIKLVTEKDIQTATENIHVSPRTIITPLARDAAKQKGIQIIVET